MIVFQNHEFCVLRLWIFYHLCLPSRLILLQKKYMQGVFFCSILLHFQVGCLFISFSNFPPISIFHYISFTFCLVFFPNYYYYFVMKCIQNFSHCRVYSSVAFNKLTKLYTITTMQFLNTCITSKGNPIPIKKSLPISPFLSSLQPLMFFFIDLLFCIFHINGVMSLFISGFFHLGGNFSLCTKVHLSVFHYFYEYILCMAKLYFIY